MAFETILVERRGRVGLVTFNRPKALNALNAQVIAELNAQLDLFEADDETGAVVLTGSDRAFAAGADIKEMLEKDYAAASATRFIDSWTRIARFRKPTVAAVAGVALGGGCEVAMMCDIILAADTARFGQPEIRLGIIPGAGGTQRLVRAVGKAKAMMMVLTGDMIGAEEAERSGLVAKVVPAATLVDEAVALGERIAGLSRPVVEMAKEAVDRAFESSLAEGLLFERREFHATFGLDDQKEGMRAFVEKRKPAFRHR
jgi:enoyl-CoA hydratase